MRRPTRRKRALLALVTVLVSILLAGQSVHLRAQLPGLTPADTGRFAALSKVAQAEFTPTPTPGTPTRVILTLISPRPFPGGALSYMLSIGGKGYGDNEGEDARCGSGGLSFGYLNQIGCFLTQQEWAALQGGEEVIVTYGGRWNFGPLDKSKLTMQEDLRLTKQQALSLLESLHMPPATASHQAARVDEAISKLRVSSAPARWLDAQHVQPEVGRIVFDLDLAVLASLETAIQIEANPDSGLHWGAYFAQNYIAVADYGLAGFMIDDAERAGAAPAEIQRAKTLHQQSFMNLRTGKYALALTGSRDAWQIAYDAKQAVSTPTPTASGR